MKSSEYTNETDFLQLSEVGATERRLLMLSNGFEPIPVLGKAAVAPGWTEGRIDGERARREAEAYPQAMSTGLRTGGLVGVDIDVEDPDLCGRIEALAAEALGATDWRRVGRKGCLLAYANLDEPLGKVTVKVPGRDVKVEVLGKGQQFVADGVHPDTSKPYRWTGICNPIDNARWELPEVTPDQVRSFAEAVMAELGDDAVITGPGYHHHLARLSPAAGEPVSKARLTEALSYLDPETDYDRWRDVLAGIGAAPLEGGDEDGERRRAIACAWSRGEYDRQGRYAAEPPPLWSKESREGLSGDNAVWRALETMPPKAGGITVGTIAHLAHEAGWKGHLSDPPLTASLASLADDAAERGTLAARGWRYLTEAEQDALPKPRFLIEGVLEEGEDGVFYAPPDHFKSFVAIDAGASVATGTPFLNHFKVNRTGGVVYLAGEGQTGVGKARRPAYRQARGITGEMSFYLVPRVPIADSKREVDDALELLRSIVEAELKPKGLSLALVLVDTLLRAMPGMDTDKAGPAGQYMQLLAAIRGEFPGVTTLTIAHTGKDESRGILGSINFGGAFHDVIQLTDAAKLPGGRHRVTVKPGKMKDAQPLPPFLIEGVEVEFTLDGETDRSLVFDYVGPVTEEAEATLGAQTIRGKVHTALREIRQRAGPLPRTCTTAELTNVILGELAVDKKAHDAIRRSLARGASAQLNPYVAHMSTGGRDPILWSYPEQWVQAERQGLRGGGD